MRRCRRAGLALVAVAGLASAWSRAAEPAAPPGRIAFGSCAHQNKPQPIWGPIVAAKPELFLFIGDNIYADTQNLDLMRAKYRKLADLPGFRKLLQTCPVLATWDDHDYGADDAGADYPKKAESQRIFLEFFNEPKDSPRWKRPGVYDAKVFGPAGKRLQVVLLDTRYFRSPLQKRPDAVRGEGPYVPTTERTATLLGENQWKWLEEQLRVPAEVRLIASSIQVVPEDHGWEKWMNLPHERQRLFQLIRDTKASGVIFLSGDRHLAELSVMDGGAGYPLYDLTSSGLNQGFPRWRPQEVNRHRVATMNFGNNFGFIAIDWDRPDPLIRLQIRDEEGDIVIQQKLDLGTLQVGKGARAPVLSKEDVAKYLNKEHTVEMTVRSAGESAKAGLIFLNSEESYRDAKNFTVVITKEAAAKFKEAKIDDPKAHFKGKVIKATGTLTLHNGKPQIRVEEPKQIAVVK